jgi:hypothetical protein
MKSMAETSEWLASREWRTVRCARNFRSFLDVAMSLHTQHGGPTCIDEHDEAHRAFTGVPVPSNPFTFWYAEIPDERELFHPAWGHRDYDYIVLFPPRLV